MRIHLLKSITVIGAVLVLNSCTVGNRPSTRDQVSAGNGKMAQRHEFLRLVLNRLSNSRPFLRTTPISEQSDETTRPASSSVAELDSKHRNQGAKLPGRDHRKH